MDITVIVSRSGDGKRAEVENGLAKLCADRGGLDVLVVPHLYHLGDRSPIWETLSTVPEDAVFVTWVHPRPAEMLLNLHGIRSRAVNLAAFETPEACCAAVADLVPSGPSIGSITEIHEPTSERWYPIIDVSRCTNCGHCLQFCLFDVYAYDAAGAVVVANPDNCKPGCPACSRLCPEGAIIFPLYERDEAIAGAPGRFISPDAAARRMIYMRTKRPCPVCGNVVDLSRIRLQTQESKICEECGGVIGEPAGSDPRLTQDALDDIDLLINDLENLRRRSS